MLKTRIDYWNCSNFANFVRGTKKPYALGWKEWDNWHNEARRKHPIRYWLAEKGLKKLQNFIMFPLDLYHTIKTYIQNRWIDHSHMIRTGLKPGSYYDFDTKVLHGLFYELVNLVEIEYAHLSKWNNEKKYNFVKGRCVEAGLDYLDWSSKLVYNEDYGVKRGDKQFGKPTAQSKTAYKILELYNWWKNRPNRPDPYDIFSEEKDGKSFYKKISKTEEDYDKEDTQMLIELIKIRGGLWT